MDPARDTSHLNAVEDGNEDPGYRELPHTVEAEQALLGAILVNNEAAHRVADFLLTEHFFEPVHGRIFEACIKLVERGQIASPITLKAFFERDEALSEVGGAQYLGRLAAHAVTIINARDYGHTIYDHFLRRQLIELGEDMVNRAYDPSVDQSALEQIEENEQQLFHLAESGQTEGGFQSFDKSLLVAIESAEAAFKRDSRLTGVPCGLSDLDELLGGLHRSDLVVLAGRPSMGKTALATNIAFHAANAYKVESDELGQSRTVDGAVVGFFSLEMSAEQLALRLLAEATEIPSNQIRRGQVSSEQFHKIVAASNRLEELRFFIDDTPGLSIAALRTRARRLKRQHNLGLVVVDYLQLLGSSSGRYQDNRVQEISEITRGLKALAKELDVPVLALSQLSRAVEQRDDKRPQLADLRESGTIEQDADVVMFVYREEYYWMRSNPKPKQRKDETEAEFNMRFHEWLEKLQVVGGEAEIIVGKQRHGPTDTVKVHFNASLTKFDNLDTYDHLPEPM